MTQARIVCIDCTAEIQRNTPLEYGGTTMPVPGLCDPCREAREEETRELEVFRQALRQTGEHRLYTISTGSHPAAQCTCGKWGFTFTRCTGDTDALVHQRLMEAHQEHMAGLKGTEQHD